MKNQLFLKKLILTWFLKISIVLFDFDLLYYFGTFSMSILGLFN